MPQHQGQPWASRHWEKDGGEQEEQEQEEEAVYGSASEAARVPAPGSRRFHAQFDAYDAPEPEGHGIPSHAVQGMEVQGVQEQGEGGGRVMTDEEVDALLSASVLRDLQGA